jgi:hypothetical protein
LMPRLGFVLAGAALLSGLAAFAAVRHFGQGWAERISTGLDIGDVAVAREITGPSGKGLYRVSSGSTVQLIAAASAARAGDVINLAPGTYSGAVLRDLQPNGRVTITSADLANPAVLIDLTVSGSRNLAFSNLVMNAQDGGPRDDFKVIDSSSISFDRVEFKGPPVRPDLVEGGLMIRDSRDISVTNSEFHDLFNGASMLANSGITISNNTFHDLRTDGIRGGSNSNVVIADNLFADIYSAPGDHPDAIQFWTTNTTASAENITITGNVFVRGKGRIAQGIFFRDEVGNLPYKKVKIDGNLIIGAMYNGIAAYGGLSGSITNNAVVGLADFPKSWIKVTLPGGVVIEGNVATLYVVGTDDKTIPAANRQTLPAVDGGAKVLSDWLETHERPGGERPIAAQLLAVLGAQAARASVCTGRGDAPRCRPGARDDRPEGTLRLSESLTRAATVRACCVFGRAVRGRFVADAK